MFLLYLAPVLFSLGDILKILKTIADAIVGGFTAVVNFFQFLIHGIEQMVGLLLQASAFLNTMQFYFPPLLTPFIMLYTLSIVARLLVDLL